MSQAVPVRAPSRWLVFLAFAAIYVIWGSSYIGNHIAIESLPPFMMSGGRMLFAGLLLIGYARIQRVPMPTRLEWKNAVALGAVLFMVNNGAIIWAQAEGLPSGITSLMIATVPMWIVLFSWWRTRRRPTWAVLIGVVVGFIGIALLLNPGESGGFNPLVALVVVMGAAAWSLGALLSKGLSQPNSPILSTGMQLTTGGGLLLLVGVLIGEVGQINVAEIQPQSLLAALYLAIFSSCIGFTSFVWLMRVSSAAKVSTYAYVNPVVAVFLGWLIAGESLTPLTMLAAGIIIGAVFIINRGGQVHLPRFVNRLLHRTPAPEAVPGRAAAR